ncbi:hypothetical protein [Chitinivibrio alkaliphilus]|uniref:Uncharacterized protein n=1 Tax=Chitinivibrio alkaliphilus ACht1 TaxID=1313304 RepID=U7DA23_9BACT|nr:hypothetical protein [Chitinivibrio alkaliphilus]ERP38847.1 hypothetical protein CALK_0621 [Chitinivibrio alkaliphilus ACht1]
MEDAFTSSGVAFAFGVITGGFIAVLLSILFFIIENRVRYGREKEKELVAKTVSGLMRRVNHIFISYRLGDISFRQMEAESREVISQIDEEVSENSVFLNNSYVSIIQQYIDEKNESLVTIKESLSASSTQAAATDYIPDGASFQNEYAPRISSATENTTTQEEEGRVSSTDTQEKEAPLVSRESETMEAPSTEDNAFTDLTEYIAGDATDEPQDTEPAVFEKDDRRDTGLEERTVTEQTSDAASGDIEPTYAASEDLNVSGTEVLKDDALLHEQDTSGVHGSHDEDESFSLGDFMEEKSMKETVDTSAVDEMDESESGDGSKELSLDEAESTPRDATEDASFSFAGKQDFTVEEEDDSHPETEDGASLGQEQETPHHENNEEEFVDLHSSDLATSAASKENSSSMEEQNQESDVSLAIDEDDFSFAIDKAFNLTSEDEEDAVEQENTSLDATIELSSDTLMSDDTLAEESPFDFSFHSGGETEQRQTGDEAPTDLSDRSLDSIGLDVSEDTDEAFPSFQHTDEGTSLDTTIELSSDTLMNDDTLAEESPFDFSFRSGSEPEKTQADDESSPIPAESPLNSMGFDFSEDTEDDFSSLESPLERTQEFNLNDTSVPLDQIDVEATQEFNLNDLMSQAEESNDLDDQDMVSGDDVANKLDDLFK